MEWRSIESAPNGLPVYLRNSRWSPPYLFYRRGKHWETTILAPGGRIRAIWSDALEQPTEWST